MPCLNQPLLLLKFQLASSLLVSLILLAYSLLQYNSYLNHPLLPFQIQQARYLLQFSSFLNQAPLISDCFKLSRSYDFLLE